MSVNNKYIVEGKTVWLNSGSPPLKVTNRIFEKVRVKWFDGSRIMFLNSVADCFTPEPTPI